MGDANALAIKAIEESSKQSYHPLPDTLKYDAYATSKDTAFLNRVMDKIIRFPEVQKTNRQIEKNTNGRHGVSFIVQDGFKGDASYYCYRVGDNSQTDRWINVYLFFLQKKTGQIMGYDSATDSIMTLKSWRKLGNNMRKISKFGPLCGSNTSSPTNKSFSASQP